MMEDVAGDRMDRMRTMRQEEAAQESPSMAEMFLDLSSAAIVVSSLATDLATVDLHVELAEQALDQASNMATVGAAAKIKSSTSSANLITRVQLASTDPHSRGCDTRSSSEANSTRTTSGHSCRT